VPPARRDGPTAVRGAPTTAQLLRYGGLGLPLAFVALPLVVQWPAHAAQQWGLPLAVLGALLLAVRVADALVDPWIGRKADGWFARSATGPWRALVVAALLLITGFAGLFFAPPGWVGSGSSATPLLAWSTVALLLTYLGYSLAQVVHQAWAARLGGDAVERSRWVGSREAFALAGVLSASVLPSLAGWAVTGAALAVLLVLGLWAMHGLPTLPASAPAVAAPAAGDADDTSPWTQRPFRSLLAIYTLNGLAASIPASLVLFFVRDRVQAPAIYEALFLAAYFGAAALGVPLWVRAVRRFGLVTAWALGMALSIAAFVGAVLVGAGDTVAFGAICVASGLALGADLVAPPALLAGVIQASGVHGRAEGRWFGWWSMATKLTLALAAGIALPLVQALGYAPGSREPAALQALAVVYAVVPCAVKALTLALLWRCRGHWTADAAPSPIPSPSADTRSR
jgi:Na+/melibiose symporter-like transporter